MNVAGDAGDVHIATATQTCNNDGGCGVVLLRRIAPGDVSARPARASFATDTRGTIYYVHTGSVVIAPGMAGANAAPVDRSRFESEDGHERDAALGRHPVFLSSRPDAANI